MITPVSVEGKKKVISIPVSKCFCRLMESNKLVDGTMSVSTEKEVRQSGSY